MRTYNTNELKEVAQHALKSEYGFSPAKKDIVLLEASGDGTRILFSVRGNEYIFESVHRYCSDGFDLGVWTGKGTIEKRA